jgi:hypothetical protein
MVEARRMFLEKKYPPGVRIAGTTMQISGSKAEGLDMKGSDTDIMNCKYCIFQCTTWTRICHPSFQYAFH